MTAQETQQNVIDRIVAQAHPDLIILFGSRARGDQRDDSDFDVLVVLPVVQDRRADAAHLRAGIEDCPFGLDILVTTPQDLAWRGQYPGTIEFAALHEGKVLYDRNAA